MKLTDIKKKLTYLALGAVMLAPALSSCELEVDPIPAEELYLRAFIKQYGVIDPEQDWNQAMKSNVSVRVPEDGADAVNVYVKVAERYYRVAYFAKVTGSVTIPFDIPEQTDTIYVEVDGKIYTTTPGGSVDASKPRKAPGSRSLMDDAAFINLGNGGVYTFPTEAEMVKVMTFGALRDATCQALVDAGHTLLVTSPDEDHKTISNTVEGAELFMTLHTPSDPASPYELTFTITGASRSVVDIAVTKADRSLYLNETLEVNPGETKVSLLIDAMPANDYFNFYMKIRETETGAGRFSNFQVKRLSSGDMAWLLVAEDLGATDDFDFNDVIVRIESTTENEAALKIENEWWQVIKDDNTHLVLGAPSRPGSQSRATNYTVLRVRAMAAGGVLDSYLHFRNGTKDFILGPGGEFDVVNDNPAPLSQAEEWHSWFAEDRPSMIKDHRNMLNTGLNSASRKSCTLIVPDLFSMTAYSKDFRNYSGDHTSAVGSSHTPGETATDWTDEVLHEWDPAAGSNYHIQGFYMTTHDPDPSAPGVTTITAPEPGAAPHMFLIPDAGWEGYWHWPLERVSITDVYPNFSRWVVSSGAFAQWYQDEPKHSAKTKEGETKGNPYVSLER